MVTVGSSDNNGKEMIEKLSFRKFEFFLEAVDDLHVPPYKGAMFRGAFGMAFRRSVCATGLSECGGCQLKENCIYFRYFETEMPTEGLRFLDGPQKVPHPFVLHPPLSSAIVFPSGYRFKVGVTLIGDAIVNLPYFVHTFRRLCEDGLGKRKGKATLIKVDDITQPEKVTVYESSKGKILPGHDALSVADLITGLPSEINRVTLDFQTPFRIQHKGVEIRKKEKVEIQKIVTLTRRRLMTLSYLYCGAVVEQEKWIDFTKCSIVSNSLNFFDWERFSNRQQKYMSLGGFIGKITFEGELNEIAPVLFAGSFVNTGKNSLFGLGQYTISFN